MFLSHYLKNGDATLFLRDAVNISDAVAFGTFPTHGKDWYDFTKEEEPQTRIRHLEGAAQALSGTHTEV